MIRNLPETWFSPAVLEGLRRRAIEGFHAFRHGGVEVGGVLFGFAGPDRLEVHEYRELECEHLYGPAFQLSSGDEGRLSALLNAPGTESSLSGMEVVGWYCSHSRTDLHLSASDLAIQENFFEEFRNLALILKPTAGFKTDAAVFIHQPGQPVAAGERMVLEPPFALAPAPSVPDEIDVVRAPRRRSVSPAFQDRQSGPRSKLFLPFTIAAVLCVIGMALFAFQNGIFHPETGGLSLRVEPSGSDLLISWGDSAFASPVGERAWIDIDDGKRRSRFDVPGSLLKKGATVYSPAGSPVHVTLSVQRELLSRKTQTLTITSPQPVTPAAALANGLKPHASEAELRQALKELTDTNRRLELTLGVLRQRRDVQIAQSRTGHESSPEN